MEDLISVIIPYYNRPEKLQRCLLSVHAQTYDNIEVIVIDDCSSLPPPTMDSSVHYYRNTENQGPGKSRNKGMEMAKGAYISFLDSDDYWDPLFLEMTAKELKLQSDVIMAYANGVTIDQSEQVIEARRGKIWAIDHILPHVLRRGRPWGTGACLWRASMIQDIEWLDTRSWEDYAFDVSAALVQNKVVAIPDKLVFYDVSGGDQLSDQDLNTASVEKAKSLIQVSFQLKDSNCALDDEMRYAMRIQFIITMTKLAHQKAENYDLLQQCNDHFGYWSHWSHKIEVWIYLHFPKSVRINQLSKLKTRLEIAYKKHLKH